MESSGKGKYKLVGVLGNRKYRAGLWLLWSREFFYRFLKFSFITFCWIFLAIYTGYCKSGCGIFIQALSICIYILICKFDAERNATDLFLDYGNRSWNCFCVPNSFPEQLQTMPYPLLLFLQKMTIFRDSLTALFLVTFCLLLGYE